jgi:CRISPR-associated protein Cas2
MMLVLITYDVSVVTPGGQKRLRNIAKTCLDYGVRVQNSVFECEIDPGHFVVLRNSLMQIFDPKTDSLRFYFLGKKGRQKVEHVGTKLVPDSLRDALIL